MTFEKKETFFGCFEGIVKGSLILRNGKRHCDVLRVGGLVMTFFIIQKDFQEKKNQYNYSINYQLS